MVVFRVYVFDHEIKFPSCLQTHNVLDFLVGGIMHRVPHKVLSVKRLDRGSSESGERGSAGP